MRIRTLVLSILLSILVMQFLQCKQEEAVVDLKQAAEKIRTAYNGGDATAWADLVTEDLINISPYAPEPIRGKDALVDVMRGIMNAFPDINLEYNLVLTEGEYLVCERVLTGTFTNPLSSPQGEIPPTGNKFLINMVSIHKITPEGLISETRDYYDTADFMKQLGLVQ